jgi:hypothetical protein
LRFKFRDFCNQDQDDSELPKEREVYPLVFSELLTYIVETKTSSNNSVVFRLADLVSLYLDACDKAVPFLKARRISLPFL